MEAEFPIFDVVSRLRALGMFTDDPAPRCILPHGSLFDWQVCSQCGDAHEPKLITGKGPEGPADGHGRGPLVGEDKNRLAFFVDYMRAGS